DGACSPDGAQRHPGPAFDLAQSPHLASLDAGHAARKNYPRAQNHPYPPRTLLAEGRHHEASWWRSRPEAGVEMRAPIRRQIAGNRDRLARCPRAWFAATHPGGVGADVHGDGSSFPLLDKSLIFLDLT